MWENVNWIYLAEVMEDDESLLPFCWRCSREFVSRIIEMWEVYLIFRVPVNRKQFTVCLFAWTVNSSLFCSTGGVCKDRLVSLQFRSSWKYKLSKR
jgi:hypothetical protein